MRVRLLPRCCLGWCLVLAVTAGCEKESERPVDEQPAAEARAAGEGELLAVLARADAVDGQVDKVVARCPICSLSMDGSQEYTMQVEGYTLYFCSAHCRDMFAADTTRSILEMRFPEE